MLRIENKSGTILPQFPSTYSTTLPMKGMFLKLKISWYDFSGNTFIYSLK